MQKSIYTDLAQEARELHPELTGISEEKRTEGGVSVSRIRIETQDAANEIGKPIGTYVTLDSPELQERMSETYENVSKALCGELKNLMGKLNNTAPVMIVGLGNRSITPDSLGPRVVEQVFVTRHITEYLPEATKSKLRAVCAFAPGVLGVTGVETLEIVKGIVEHVKPKLVIAIDALASRRSNRITTTVQLTDTGISPGSGIGNKRAGLNGDTLGVPVIAVGVPLVVYASTIAQDTIGLMADETGMHGDEEKLINLAEKVISQHTEEMIVTPKDIDTLVADMSRILADGINLALHELNYEEVRSLIA